MKEKRYNFNQEDEMSFLCAIFRTRKFSLINQNLYYEIIEEVIDKRGTSSTTYTEVIFKSEQITVSDSNKNPKIKFNYPELTGMQSMKINDVSIKWKMKLEGTTYFGIVLKYPSEFNVYLY